MVVEQHPVLFTVHHGHLCCVGMQEPGALHTAVPEFRSCQLSAHKFCTEHTAPLHPHIRHLTIRKAGVLHDAVFKAASRKIYPLKPGIGKIGTVKFHTAEILVQNNAARQVNAFQCTMLLVHISSYPSSAVSST